MFTIRCKSTSNVNFSPPTSSYYRYCISIYAISKDGGCPIAITAASRIAMPNSRIISKHVCRIQTNKQACECQSPLYVKDEHMYINSGVICMLPLKEFKMQYAPLKKEELVNFPFKIKT